MADHAKAKETYNSTLRTFEEGKLRLANGTFVRDRDVARKLALEAAREHHPYYGQESVLTNGATK